MEQVENNDEKYDVEERTSTKQNNSLKTSSCNSNVVTEHKYEPPISAKNRYIIVANKIVNLKKRLATANQQNKILRKRIQNLQIILSRLKKDRRKDSCNRNYND